MTTVENSKDKTLQTYKVAAGRSSVSGLSSGAFMTVQLHLAHSSSFCGAGIVAGGPFRCAESFREAAFGSRSQIGSAVVSFHSIRERW